MENLEKYAKVHPHHKWGKADFDRALRIFISHRHEYSPEREQAYLHRLNIWREKLKQKWIAVGEIIF